MRFQAPLTLLLSVLVCSAPFADAQGSSEADAPEAFKNQVLSGHNANRAQYGARPLTWSTALYPDTLQWAQQCQFNYSDGQGAYGENLASVGSPSAGFDDALKLWMSEASKYDYANAAYSPSTRNFAQVVWKSTTQVACAVADCPAGSVSPQASQYIVCRYTPSGNIAGEYSTNVGRHV